MVNQLVNELDIYDEPFVKNVTNGPYLVRARRALRAGSATGKPLVWDAADGTAKPFDAEVGDYALDGHVRGGRHRGQPGFQRLKDHVRRYTPELVEEITLGSGGHDRRLAREYGEASQIGATIDIDG